MVLTDDPGACGAPSLAAEPRVRHRTAVPSRGQLGHNFRLTNLQAALGVAQIERKSRRSSRESGAVRPRITSRRLPESRAGSGFPSKRGWARNVYWMFGVVLDDDSRPRRRGTRSSGCGSSESRRVPSSWGCTSSRHFSSEACSPASAGFPVSERLARRGLYLPSGLGLTDEQLGCRSPVRFGGRGAVVSVPGGSRPAYAGAVYDSLYVDKDYKAECDLLQQVFAKYGSSSVGSKYSISAAGQAGTPRSLLPVGSRSSASTCLPR